MATELLDICQPGREEAEDFVARHFSRLVTQPGDDQPLSSDVFRGGQVPADKALAALDLAGYTRNRTQAYPERRRGASRLSPYVRHGLLDLPTLWDQIQGPDAEVERFQLELLWQEYARHLYARLGSDMKQPLRFQPSRGPGRNRTWDHSMGCVEITTGELEDDGWLVGQSRLWLASQWAVRQGGDWRDGEDYFFRHLLDGSRAANLLGWQTAIGTATGRVYNFTRWQVESRAPGLCASCELNTACPIDRWPERAPLTPVAVDRPLLYADPDTESTAGPSQPCCRPSAFPASGDGDTETTHGVDTAGRGAGADVVWMTAESMGDADPALAANPDLPVAFVFDRPLLARLKLSTKRLVFMVETLAELATRRELEVYLGTPAQALVGRRVAATFAPVPGWRRHASTVDPVEIHPWPWLYRPGSGDISSFAHWRRQLPSGPRAEPGQAVLGDFTRWRNRSAIPVTANPR
ncbi:MAG: deoxyribodipyrimidine photolyase [Acidimicrobiia bacterium]|nr:deoxyribodipyrimidine photolyase [Acidimicrobiia bacterium]